MARDENTSSRETICHTGASEQAAWPGRMHRVLGDSQP